MAYVSVVLRSIVVVMGKVRLEGSKHLGIACIMKYSLTILVPTIQWFNYLNLFN